MINVEIWASGGGTNADAILHYFKNHNSISIQHLACNRREAGAFDVAQRHGISSSYWGKENWNSNDILEELQQRKTDYIILAGFLKLVPPEVTRLYEGKMLNLHPSLLPNYGGKDMYGENVHRAVLAAGEVVTGITIHEVNEQFDQGKIIAQFSTPLEPSSENLDSIKIKIQQLEHRNFPPIIEAWIKSNTI